MQTHYYQASIRNGVFEAPSLKALGKQIVEYYSEYPTYEPGNAAPQVKSITHFTNNAELELTADDVARFNAVLEREFDEASSELFYAEMEARSNLTFGRSL